MIFSFFTSYMFTAWIIYLKQPHKPELIPVKDQAPGTYLFTEGLRSYFCTGATDDPQSDTSLPWKYHTTTLCLVPIPDPPLHPLWSLPATAPMGPWSWAGSSCWQDPSTFNPVWNFQAEEGPESESLGLWYLTESLLPPDILMHTEISKVVSSCLVLHRSNYRN